MKLRGFSRALAVALVAVVGTLFASAAGAILFTIDGDPIAPGLQPIVIDGSEAGNPGVLGTINPVVDLGGGLPLVTSGTVILLGGAIDVTAQDVIAIDVTLNLGSSVIDGLSFAAALPFLNIPINVFFGNPVGAGYYSGDAGIAPSGVTACPIVPCGAGSANFNFAPVLNAGQTTVRLFATYNFAAGLPLAQDQNANVSFMISSGTDFSVQGRLVPEPSTAVLLGLGLLGLVATARRSVG